MSSPHAVKKEQFWRPTEDRIFVREDTVPDEIVRGGIIVPNVREQEAQITGTVLAVGPGKWNDDTTARVPHGFVPGDRVAFGKFAGVRVRFDNADIVAIRATDIMAKMA